MRRSSFLLPRRMSRRMSRRLPRPRRHARYHYSHTQKRVKTHRIKKHTKKQVRHRGGRIGETTKEWYGIPITNGAWITNGKGKTLRISEIEPVLERSDTQALPGDDDV